MNFKSHIVFHFLIKVLIGNSHLFAIVNKANIFIHQFNSKFKAKKRSRLISVMEI